MQGSCALPPKHKLIINNSFEYKDKPRRCGFGKGTMTKPSYDTGEFVYYNLQQAYPDGDFSKASTLQNYWTSSMFCPSMSNAVANKQVVASESYSEHTNVSGANLPVYLTEQLEKRGLPCCFVQMAKGGVSILHFFDRQMMDEYTCLAREYNNDNPIAIRESFALDLSKGCPIDYYKNKVTAFYQTAQEQYCNDDLSVRPFVWFQGESDCGMKTQEYYFLLKVLWNKVKSIGATHLFCVRVDYWSLPSIDEIMRAQELFCNGNGNCYVVTRIASFIPTKAMDVSRFYSVKPSRNLYKCRDEYFGYDNMHINERGLMYIAKKSAKNICRVLLANRPVRLEKERVVSLINNQSDK